MSTITDWRKCTLTIPNTATDSGDVLDLGGNMRGPVGLCIIAPAVLVETVNVLVADEVGGTFGVLQSGGADIVLAAGKATQITYLTAGALMLRAGAGVAGAKAFKIVGNRFSPLRA